MIARLRGLLLSKAPNQIVVECGGVGYELAISITTFTTLPVEGAEVALHVYTNVREDQIALYGFMEMQEKRLFEKLLTISGIGPKLAITVLSGISGDRLVEAIRSADHATLTRVPGIGKKTAERVVLELKDKLEDMVMPVAAGAAAPSDGQHGSAADDAISALVNLGYQRPVAQKAVAAAVVRDKALAGEFEALFRAAMLAIR